MGNPIISVIIPIYNVERFLDQCLFSVRSQTYSALEIICLNDGSTDASPNIIARHAQEDDRIIAVNKTNEGYGATCNRGLSLAKGKWIAIIEPDDYINADAFEKLISFASSFDSDIDVVKAGWMDVYNWDDPDKLSEKPCSLFKRIKTSKKPFRLEDEPLLVEGHPSIWSALYSKTFLDRHTIRFEAYPGAGWADNPFLIDTLVQAKAIVYLDKAFYHYRVELPNDNRPNDNAIKLPAERWLEMSKRLENYGVTDKAVWAAHYVRGFNYLEQTASKLFEGWGNTLLRDCAKQVFATMDEKLVMEIGKLSPYVKQRYREIAGLPPVRISKSAYFASLAERAIHKIASTGIK